MTPPPKTSRGSKGSGPPSPSMELPETAHGLLGHITRPLKGRVSRIKKDEKNTFMLLCRGQLKEFH